MPLTNLSELNVENIIEIEANLLDFVKLSLIIVVAEKRARVPLKLIYRHYCFFVEQKNEIPLGYKHFRTNLTQLIDQIDTNVFLAKVSGTYTVFNVRIKESSEDSSFFQAYKAFYSLK